MQAVLSMGLMFLGSIAAFNALAGISVSPGGLYDTVRISDTCPTFSWGRFSGAQGYEVAVFHVTADGGTDYQTALESSQPVIQVQIAAPALSWTPSRDHCLQGGGSYLWFVRATSGEDRGNWSDARKFEVDPDNDLLEEAVRQEVTNQLSEPATWRQLIQSALQSEPDAALLLSQAGTRFDALVGHRAATGSPAIPTASAGAVTRNAISQPSIFSNPSAFRISSVQGVVFDNPHPGNLIGGGGEGSIPVEGPGVRFMWYPGKTALRAGRIKEGGEQWNDANIGVGSVAFGRNTMASGRNSTALGYETLAKSFSETAIGTGNSDSTPLSADLWAETDRLFVIGNGRFKANQAGLVVFQRSDAMVVLKNGNTGIGTSLPGFRLQVDRGSDCAVSGGGFIVAGDVNKPNICIDNNEIMARNAAGTSTLNLNFNGGPVKVGGDLIVKHLGSGGSTDVCRNGLDILSTCSSSGRYKEAIAPLRLGLDIVQQLKPVSFKWKDLEGRDLGFVAETVAEIAPLLVTYNKDGQVEGVKYKQLTAVLVNAIQMQQEQLGIQQKMAEEGRQQLATMRGELAGYRQLKSEIRQLQVEVKQLRRKAKREAQGSQLVSAD
ncbi:tail fiber domain-containing protein [Thiolapillus sp.]